MKQTLTRTATFLTQWKLGRFVIASFWVNVLYDLEAHLVDSPTVGETILNAVPDPARAVVLSADARLFFDDFLFNGRKVPGWMLGALMPSQQRIIDATRRDFSMGKIHEEFCYEELPLEEKEVKLTIEHTYTTWRN